jgi:ribosomal protein S18
MSPVKIRRNKGGKSYRVTDGGKLKARRTSKTKATRQARLLNALRRGFKARKRRKR